MVKGFRIRSALHDGGIAMYVQAKAATIHVMASTTVLPVVSTAAKVFHKKPPDVAITVSGVGVEMARPHIRTFYRL